MPIISNSFHISLYRGKSQQIGQGDEINLGDRHEIIISNIDGKKIGGEWGFYLFLDDAGALVKRIPVAHIGRVFDTSAFNAIYTNRCIIPVSGFVITKKEEGEVIKYAVEKKDGDKFYVAGIWESIMREGETKNTFLCITHDSNEKLLPYLKNTPLILDQDFAYTWLNKDIPADQIPDLIYPLDEDLLEITKI